MRVRVPFLGCVWIGIALIGVVAIDHAEEGPLDTSGANFPGSLHHPHPPRTAHSNDNNKNTNNHESRANDTNDGRMEDDNDGDPQSARPRIRTRRMIGDVDAELLEDLRHVLYFISPGLRYVTGKPLVWEGNTPYLQCSCSKGPKEYLFMDRGSMKDHKFVAFPGNEVSLRPSDLVEPSPKSSIRVILKRKPQAGYEIYAVKRNGDPWDFPLRCQGESRTATSFQKRRFAAPDLVHQLELIGQLRPEKQQFTVTYDLHHCYGGYDFDLTVNDVKDFYGFYTHGAIAIETPIDAKPMFGWEDNFRRFTSKLNTTWEYKLQSASVPKYEIHINTTKLLRMKAEVTTRKQFFLWKGIVTFKKSSAQRRVYGWVRIIKVVDFVYSAPWEPHWDFFDWSPDCKARGKMSYVVEGRTTLDPLPWSALPGYDDKKI